MDVTATSLSGDSLFAGITSANGGTVGSTAGVIFNVSGTSTFAHDATSEITGSDGAQAAAIDINRGSYDAGGTFLAFIDGSGAITFNNASVHADVLKVGALGTNGVLNIGGGTLSADTTLKFYSGSNGTLNFTSSVTLSSGTAMDLAANTITIQPSVLVTIAGAGGMANIYTNNANYSGFGGTNRSNGTFGGNGANNPQPLSSAPLFDSPSTRVATRSTRTSAAVIHVTDSSQLSSLLDNAAPGPNGKVCVSPDGRSRNQSVRGSTPTMVAELHRSVDAKAKSGVLASRFQ